MQPERIRARRAIIIVTAALAAAFAVWLLCRWVGYELQLRIGNEPRYTIINDEYSQIIDVPEEGLTQTLPLKAGQTLYGVRFKFSTYGKAYQCGMLMVELYNADGEKLDLAAGNYLNIFDENFTAFVFNAPYTAETDETLTVYLYNEVAWDGPLGLWASEGTVDTMPLYAGENTLTAANDQNATLAMQIVSDYSGTWAQTLAEILSVPLALAAFAAVLLLGLKAPLWSAAAVVSVLLGIGFVYLTPALTAPDEYTHLAAAYELASKWNGQTAADENGKLLVRECDAAHFGTETGEIGIFALKAQEEARQNETGSANELTAVSDADAGQGSGSYWVQALGIWLARAQGKNFYTMLRCGRIANLLVYAALAALAVFLAPKTMHGVFLCAALLPMPLQLAGSLSPDAFVIGTVFCYTALCLRLRAQKGTPVQTLGLAVLALAVAPAKAIYLPLVLLCLAIPADHISTGRIPASLFGGRVSAGRLVQGGISLAAAALWCAVNLSEVAYAARDMNKLVLAAGGAAALLLLVLAVRLYGKVKGNPRAERRFWCGLILLLAAVAALGIIIFTHTRGALEPDELAMTNPNGDSVWTFSLGYVCRNLPAACKLLLRSIPEQGALWLQGLLGTTLGEPIVYRIDVSWLLGIGLVLALLAAAMPVRGETPPLGRHTAWGSAALIFAVIAISFLAALNWTPINYETIFGVQGRYWLPLLPLALALCKRSKALAAQRSLARGAAVAVTALTVLTVVQGYALYASWQA